MVAAVPFAVATSSFLGVGMTRFRMFSTLLVLAAGTGMGAIYLQPDKAIAPQRIKAESTLPADAPSPTATTGALARPAALQTVEPARASPLSTVALPSGPLLRSATDSPPIDTSSLDPAMVVRHDNDASPGLTGRIDSLSSPQSDAPYVQPAPVARPLTTRRPRSRTNTARTDKKIEKLFLNPLGVR